MIEAKKCKICGIIKPVSEFQLTRENKVPSRLCKICFKDADARRGLKYRQTERYRTTAKAQYIRRQNDPTARAKKKEYSNGAGRELILQSRIKWLKNNPDKRRAHVARRKLINPMKCEECGLDCRAHGHHEDYNKPLEVIWLCPSCHAKKHSR